MRCQPDTRKLDTCFRTMSTDGVRATVYSPQQHSLAVLYTDTVWHQLAILSTAHHTLLRNSIRTYFQCFAYWKRQPLPR